MANKGCCVCVLFDTVFTFHKSYFLVNSLFMGSTDKLVSEDLVAEFTGYFCFGFWVLIHPLKIMKTWRGNFLGYK